MTGAVLANLQIVTAGVDPAENPREPGHEQVVLRDVSPHLLAGELAGREPPEVLRAAERIASEQLRLEGVEPLLGAHVMSSPGSREGRILAHGPAPRDLEWWRVRDS